MLKQFLFLLLITFCWSINIKLEINDNLIKYRHFNYLLKNNVKQPIFNCYLLYRINKIENKIYGKELEINKIYLFKDVPNELFNENKNAEFIIEFLNNSFLTEIIPTIKNQVL